MWKTIRYQTPSMSDEVALIKREQSLGYPSWLYSVRWRTLANPLGTAVSRFHHLHSPHHPQHHALPSPETFHLLLPPTSSTSVYIIPGRFSLFNMLLISTDKTRALINISLQVIPGLKFVLWDSLTPRGPSWPGSDRDPPASRSQVLWLKHASSHPTFDLLFKALNLQINPLRVTLSKNAKVSVLKRSYNVK